MPWTKIPSHQGSPYCAQTPNNIPLGRSLEAKTSDMGVSKAIEIDNKKTMTCLPGTPDFMLPEALNRKAVYGIYIAGYILLWGSGMECYNTTMACAR